MAKSNHLGALAAAAGTLAAVGLLVLMLVLVDARPAEATFPGDNGRIAFASNRPSGPGADYEIYSASSTGRKVDVQEVTTGITGKSLLTALPQCQDGVDNDGDGLIDLNDPGCLSATDNDETG
jgi:hypothetical protein